MTKRLQATDAQLLEKYNTEAFMYVEYPHRRYWTRKVNDEVYKTALKKEFAAGTDNGAMLYVHMPYCQAQCWFCTCHVEITKDYDDVKAYLQLLYKEIDLLADFCEQNKLQPAFDEIHLGGGSPTFIKEPEFDILIEKMRRLVDFSKLKEFSIEIDPRRVKHDRMRYYHSKGINRISFGVQDFDVEVQKSVNRIQPAELTERLLTPEIRGLFSNGVNFDLICGLPKQTVETLRHTIGEVTKLSPDRICLNYLHIAPTFSPHQNLMPMNELPDIYRKKELFTTALELLTAAGYVRTGYDHFAKPTDAVVKAMQRGEMHWNRLGVSAGRYLDVVGIGVSSVSTIGPYTYAQNTFSRKEYSELLDQGRLPITIYHELNADDVLRRDVIQTLRSYFVLDMKTIEERYTINFRSYFTSELERLAGFIADGIVEIQGNTIVITEIGQQFANLVCSNFDAYLSRKSQVPAGAGSGVAV